MKYKLTLSEVHLSIIRLALKETIQQEINDAFCYDNYRTAINTIECLMETYNTESIKGE